MRYVMGLDGGGTKTEAIVADETGRILGRGRGGPMNISFVPLDVARKSVSEAMTKALASAGLNGVDLVCVGSAGPVDILGPDREIAVKRWHVAYEHGLCLASAVQAGHAVVILAGTGCFEWARGPRGEHRVDGKGALIGDEGSAFWIARAGLVAMGRASDKRGPATRVTDLIMEKLQITDPAMLGRKIYGNGGMPRHEIAALARCVTGAAAAGDEVAKTICREAAGLLAYGAEVCIQEVGLSGHDFPVVLTGGVMSAGEVITGPLMEAIQGQEPGARFMFPKHEPAVGGVLAGLAELGVGWTPQLLENLDRTLATEEVTAQ